MTVIHTVHHVQTQETETTIVRVLKTILEMERLAKVCIVNALPWQFPLTGSRVTINS